VCCSVFATEITYGSKVKVKDGFYKDVVGIVIDIDDYTSIKNGPVWYTIDAWVDCEDNSIRHIIIEEKEDNVMIVKIR
jgi:hypothetical protein